MDEWHMIALFIAELTNSSIAVWPDCLLLKQIRKSFLITANYSPYKSYKNLKFF